MLTVRAPGLQRVALAFRQGGEKPGKLAQVAEDDFVRGLRLQHEPGVGHVLRGRAPVDEAARVPLTERGKLADERNEGMPGEVDALAQRVEVDQLRARLTRNLRRRVRRDEPFRRLRARQRGLEVEPALKLRNIREDAA